MVSEQVGLSDQVGVSVVCLCDTTYCYCHCSATFVCRLVSVFLQVVCSVGLKQVGEELLLLRIVLVARYGFKALFCWPWCLGNSSTILNRTLL